MPGLNRYPGVTQTGLLRIDKLKLDTEVNLDGKYLLRCSDPSLSAEDIARYKLRLQVERGWRDLKTHLELLTPAQRGILTELGIDPPRRSSSWLHAILGTASGLGQSSVAS
jgi:hypothetical protein